jgi:ATP-dependent RNA helicase DeaD
VSEDFAKTGLTIDEALARSLEKEGITAPTAVQCSAIPPVLAGKDIVIQSGTGTGKTLAYLLPLLQRARLDPSFRIVVMAPSPELAMQILRTAETYKGAGLRSASLVGSGSIERQKDRLKQHPQIVVGTPGRVLEMIFARKLATKSIKALVLDEVDQILSEQNEAELREICSRPEFDSQIIVASATFGRRGDAFATDFMTTDRVRLQLETSPLRDNIRHRYVQFAAAAPQEGELARLIDRLDIAAALVFVHKSFYVARLFHALRDHGIACATLSAAGNKLQRQQAIEAFKKREARVLVATDAAARGIDIKDLDWVIHFELPNDKNAYLHRAGRTGRAGKTGNSVVMVTQAELPNLERMARELRIELTPIGEREYRAHG